MGNPIEWDEPETATRRERLEVRTIGRAAFRDATIDDLKRACEAVGLHVVDRGVPRLLAALPPTEGRATDEELLAMGRAEERADAVAWLHIVEAGFARNAEATGWALSDMARTVCAENARHIALGTHVGAARKGAR